MRDAPARRLHFSNDFPTGFSPLKYCFANAWLTIATRGIGVGRAEVAAAREAEFASRPAQPGETLTKSEKTSLGGAPLIEILPDRALPAHQRPSDQRHFFHAGHRAQMFRHLVPEDRRLRRAA